MGTATAMYDSTAAGHMAVRILVAIYTVASALGAISGTNLSILLQPFASDSVANAAMTAIVATLCVFMLLGIQRRAMALLLAVIFLWASYFAFLGPNAAVSEGSHWRDMILIAALLLIYADTAHSAENDIASVLRAIREPRSIYNSMRVSPPANTDAGPDLKVRRTSQTVFHEDLDQLGGR